MGPDRFSGFQSISFNIGGNRKISRGKEVFPLTTGTVKINVEVKNSVCILKTRQVFSLYLFHFDAKGSEIIISKIEIYLFHCSPDENDKKLVISKWKRFRENRGLEHKRTENRQLLEHRSLCFPSTVSFYFPQLSGNSGS